MTCTRLRCALLLAAALLPATAAAEPGHYQLDPVHTRVLFRIDHAGFSRALGTFSGASGELLFDPEDWSSAHVDVNIPLQRLDLGDPDWNERVLGRPFLDAGRHPQAHFRSTRVEPGDALSARVYGELSLRGESAEVVLDVRLNALRRHPLTFRRTAGFSASARLDRRDFGMDAWPNVIGQTVELWIEAEAVQVRGKAPAQRKVPAGPSGDGPCDVVKMEPDPATDTETDDADPQSS